MSGCRCFRRTAAAQSTYLLPSSLPFDVVTSEPQNDISHIGEVHPYTNIRACTRTRTAIRTRTCSCDYALKTNKRSKENKRIEAGDTKARHLSSCRVFCGRATPRPPPRSRPRRRSHRSRSPRRAPPRTNPAGSCPAPNDSEGLFPLTAQKHTHTQYTHELLQIISMSVSSSPLTHVLFLCSHSGHLVHAASQRGTSPGESGR